MCEIIEVPEGFLLDHRQQLVIRYQREFRGRIDLRVKGVDEPVECKSVRGHQVRGDGKGVLCDIGQLQGVLQRYGFMVR